MTTPEPGDTFESGAFDRLIDYTFTEGGPIKKDKLWFFGSARYFTVNNFIAGTFFDDGSQGIDDQLIKSAMIRLTYQVTPKVKFSAYFDEIDKYRGHDVQVGIDPETASVRWFSPAYHTAAAKITSTVTSRLLLEGGYSNNTEDYTNSYQKGIEQPRFSPAWYSTTAHNESDIVGFSRTGGGFVADHDEPTAVRGERVGVLRDRVAQHQGRVPGHLGSFWPHGRLERGPGAELSERY